MRKQDQQLFDAVENKEISLVKKLLTRLLVFKRADVNARNHFGSTALHIAAIYDSYDIALFILKHGAHVDETDNDGKTPLHHAAHNGHLAFVKLLVENAADCNRADNRGQCPLGLAITGNHLKILKYLIHAGADVNADDPNGCFPGSSLLHRAVTDSKPQVVALLLANGADPHYRDQANRSALDYAKKSTHEILNLFKIHISNQL